MYDIAAGACPPRFMCFAERKKIYGNADYRILLVWLLEVKSLLQLV
jgi:hypothetical protein